VVGGYLAPSSDDYVRGKLRLNAMSLVARNAMCALATASSDWIDVAPYGTASASSACDLVYQALCAVLPTEHSSVLNVVELCGADHVARYSLWQRGRHHVVLGREPHTSQVRKALSSEEFCAKSSTGPLRGSKTTDTTEDSSSKQQHGHKNRHDRMFIVVDENLPPVSSTAVRQLLSDAKGQQELRTNGFLHPAVVDYLVREDHDLYLLPRDTNVKATDRATQAVLPSSKNST